MEMLMNFIILSGANDDNFPLVVEFFIFVKQLTNTNAIIFFFFIIVFIYTIFNRTISIKPNKFGEHLIDSILLYSLKVQISLFAVKICVVEKA